MAQIGLDELGGDDLDDYYMSDDEIETFVETHIPLDHKANNTVICCCLPHEPHNELMKFKFMGNELAKKICLFEKR